MDTLGYMGNGLLMKHLGSARIHELVYSELDQMSVGVRRDLLGIRGSGDAVQDASRQMRAKNVDSFSEFLPSFPILPIYIHSLYALSLIVGLRRSTVFLSVCSSFFLVF